MKTFFIRCFIIAITLMAITANAGSRQQSMTQDSHFVSDHQSGETTADHGHDHDHEPADDHETEKDHQQKVELTQQQRQLAGIRVAEIQPQLMVSQLYAPGEIKANGYRRYLVSPRVASVVLRRHVVLGEHVTLGQPLVTLFSETVVSAQAAYLVAWSEWQTVETLGKKSVGNKRFVSAQTDYKAAHGRLVAYGLTEQAIAASLDEKTRLGEYVLHAEITGAVLSDDFHQGQSVAAGGTLIDLADESQLWVDASLPASAHINIPVGSIAWVQVDHDKTQAKVIQSAHTIDLQTRTRVVRLLIDNPQDHFHSGMFADVYFRFETPEPVMAVPETALMRNDDGQWIVFVQAPHATEDDAIKQSFTPQPVKLGQPLLVAGDAVELATPWRQVSGLTPGVQVVTEGAFFVASESAKSGFDPHNH